MVKEIIEYWRGLELRKTEELHKGKAYSFFFASPHILFGYKTTDAEIDRKYSYNTHRAVAKCIDFLRLSEGKSTFGRPKYKCEGIILKCVLTCSVWGMKCVGYVGRYLYT